MRRQDIQLIALARQGDVDARYEAGRRYLLGAEGFPRHISSGLDYLSHPSVRGTPQAAKIITENLPLQDILAQRQEPCLRIAAAAGVPAGQAKLGAWLCASSCHASDGMPWLERAAAGGHAGAAAAVAASVGRPTDARREVLQAMAGAGDLNALSIAILAARQAIEGAAADHIDACLQCTLALAPVSHPEVAELVLLSLGVARETKRPSLGIRADLVEQCLDARTARGDVDAAFTLGSALCRIDCGALPWSAIVAGANMRKGAALLLRAADGGRDDAWPLLFRVHADHHSSVANPQMARFFLEKAATSGQVDAQRRLGAIVLRSSSSLDETEQAIHWLHEAADKGDSFAMRLLKSLVLPVAGDEDDAATAIAALRREDPWLAARLRIARDFGLTKLEALSLDPVPALRPWGLVVGKNPFVNQVKLSAPRAVPATSPAALQNLRTAVAQFAQLRQEMGAYEGDLRRRSVQLRRAMERYHIHDSLFFAAASSMTLESLRQGAKWAFRARVPLAAALAA